MPLRFLIVEDQVITAQDIGVRLVQLGHEVVGMAHDPETACALADRLAPNAAICDIDLGATISGLTIGSMLAARGIAVIYLTGHLDQAVCQARDHAVALLSKPLHPQEFAGAVARASALG